MWAPIPIFYLLQEPSSPLDPVGSPIGGSDITGNALENSRVVVAAWADTWKDVITPDSVLYQSIANLAVLAALTTLGFWLYQFVKDWNEGRERKAFTDLIWPMFLVALLAGGGAGLAQVTLGARDVIYKVNEDLLQVVHVEGSLEEAYEIVRNTAAVDALVRQKAAKCDAFTGAEQTSCLERILPEIDKILASNSLEIMANNSLEYLRSVVEGEADPGEDLLGAISGTTTMVLTQVLMGAFSMAFYNIIEASMLLTALIGPLPLGASLFPWGRKPIITWLAGFGGLGLAKISFNILVGLASQVVIESGLSDALWFPLFIGLLAPLLAMAIAAGGGIAIFSAFSSGASIAVRAISAGLIDTGAGKTTAQ